ncbi:MAG: hypothetical protein GX273_06635 [Bacteroidales bacterium]|nr:hypothetical protein [Bacteroidales bacterium]
MERIPDFLKPPGFSEKTPWGNSLTKGLRYACNSRSKIMLVHKVVPGVALLVLVVEASVLVWCLWGLFGWLSFQALFLPWLF